MEGRRVLLVDDILDEGHTLKAVTRWCEDQDAADVRVAVLEVKVHDSCVDGVCADYVGVEVPERYVISYGMDFHEQGCNMAATYELAEYDACGSTGAVAAPSRVRAWRERSRVR